MALQAVKEQFRDAGFESLDREQFIKLMCKLNPSFGADELTTIADGALASSFTGGGKMCCSALVDYLFGVNPVTKSYTRPNAIIMGDLGSGKTSAYFLKMTEQGMVQVKELMDGDTAELPSLAGCAFEEWSASFERAAGDYIHHYPVHIGATQWYREMPEQQQVALGLRLWSWGEKFPSGFRLLEVSGLKEATCEAIACRHACQAVLKVGPDIIVSTGTGSMQCTCGSVSQSSSLDTKAWSKRDREDLPAFRSAAREALRPFVPSFQQLNPSSLALFIGASWYAIVSAGMASAKSEPFISPRVEAIISLVAFASHPDTAMRDATNVWRLVEALNMMHVHDVAFGRNWLVHGENFRTTWSVGYFLEGCP